ncbi:MAG: ABC transporter ATP-binding protein, partial [Halobacteriaceae archaeon]
PMKIRPDKYDDMNDDLWERIRVFREVARERSQAERSLSQQAREWLGLETDLADIDEILSETFGDISIPDEIQSHIDQAADYMEANEHDKAREYLQEEFSSECDETLPDMYDVDETDRTSRCHRHAQQFTDPREIIQQNIFTD